MKSTASSISYVDQISTHPDSISSLFIADILPQNMAPKTILVLGTGPGTGYSVARTFKAEGYQVEIASRKPDADKTKVERYLPFTGDTSNYENVEVAFALVREVWCSPV